MIEFLPQLISAAFIGAASPVAAMATIAVLSSPSGVRNAFGILVGWSALLVLLGVLMRLLLGDSGPALSDGSKSVVKLILGLVLVSFGLRHWIGARHPLTGAVTDQAHGAALPGWLSAIDRLSFAKSFGLGFLLLGASPANVAVFLSANQGLTGSSLSPGLELFLLVLLILAIDLCILIPLGIYLLLPERAPRWLASGRNWLLSHDQVLTTWILIGFGALLTLTSVPQLA